MDVQDQKGSILAKLREMLLRQRDKFQSYLDLLEKEEQSIRMGDEEKVAAQVEVEGQIIAEIFSLKKVVEPLQDLYRAAYPRAEDTVPPLERTLARMQEQVAARNLRNRRMLQSKVDELRQEVRNLRRMPSVRSPYADAPAPRLVDITT